MTEISVTIDLKEIQALSAQKLSPAIVRALRKAGSTALRDMRAELSKRVRERKRIKAGTIRRALRVRRARGSRIEDMEWAIDVAGDAVRVTEYPHRQTKRGVSVEINRGQRSLIRGGFVATMPSGHKGVFVRPGRQRLPIDEQFASRVVDAISHEGEIAGIHRRGQETFQRVFRGVLPMEIAKG
jgi:hypothetical protein